MKTWVHSLLACPQCDAKMPASTGVLHDQPPADGDYTLCDCCGGLLRFRFKISKGSKLARLEAATEQDLLEMPEDQFREIAAVQQALMSARNIPLHPGNKRVILGPNPAQKQ